MASCTISTVSASPSNRSKRCQPSRGDVPALTTPSSIVAKIVVGARRPEAEEIFVIAIQDTLPQTHEGRQPKSAPLTGSGAGEAPSVPRRIGLSAPLPPGRTALKAASTDRVLPRGSGRTVYRSAERYGFRPVSTCPRVQILHHISPGA